MMAVAPNLTVLLGEFVGARLISQAGEYLFFPRFSGLLLQEFDDYLCGLGSLLNLAKHPASTVQILGAEKALFRALKTRKDTPKYGYIYNSPLIGQASTAHKGKVRYIHLI